MNLPFRNIVAIAMQAFIMAVFAHGQAQQITITISSPQAEVKAGAPVPLHIVLANLTGKEVRAFRNPGYKNAERFYSISVSDSGGNVRPTTSYGDAILNKGAQAGSKIQAMIGPGQKLEEDATVSDIFDMKEVGIYKVVVKRPSPLNPRVIIQSNEIEITVSN